MFEIRELRQLISLDEFRHFGRAAKAVGLSQPALTKSLQRIEQAFGARLFERSRAGVAPTNVGKEVLKRARQMVHDADELKRTIDKMTGTENVSVRFGVGPAMAETYVAAAIAEVTVKHPDKQFIVRVDNFQQLSDSLIAGELDFYVADVSKARIDARCQYSSLPPHKFVWFCRSGHPLAGRGEQPIARSELLRYPIATPRMPAWAVEWFAAALGSDGVETLPPAFPAVECESYTMVKRIVLSSDCLSAALHDTLAEELNAKSLSLLAVDAPALTTQAGIIRLADRTLSPLAREIATSIEKHARQAGNRKTKSRR